jgi:hypothetical protein
MDELLELGSVTETTQHATSWGDRFDPIAFNCTAHLDDEPGCGPWEDLG